MFKVLRNAGALLKNPSIIAPYLRWLTARIQGRVPRFTIAPNVSIGEWINFSEYHAYTTASGILPWEEVFFRRLLGTSGNKVAFDVGANIGVFTCFFASLSNCVHSFEPVPCTFRRLTANLAANSLDEHTTSNCVALGERDGFVTFKCYHRAPGSNRIETSVLSSAGPDVDLLPQVPVTTLDTYCERQGITVIDLLKIDVEGMEPLVLRGASRLLSSKDIKAILIEVCPDNLIEAGHSAASLYEEFVCCGYQPFLLKRDGAIGKALNRDQLSQLGSENVVLLAK